MNRLLFLLMLTVANPLSLTGQMQAASLERQVFVAESSFAASMAQRDLQAFASFVSPEAIFFGDTMVMRGKRAVIDGWRPFFEKPAAPFSWRPDQIEVLPSGNLAISNGPVFNPSGKKVGTFSSIWRRESDGKWQIIFDKGCP
ncbi:MAG TPA: nuclear transport factor 2 family protein [Gemmatimonadales bacterium]|nr:nuclear transport factor 2 family protein [Gemmatimonadales bacterium]